MKWLPTSLIAAVLAGCAPQAENAASEPIGAPDVPTAESASAAEAINGFGLDLYRLQAEKPGNVFLSPLSIESAFGPLLAGARGTTADEIARTMRLPSQGADIHRDLGGLADDLRRKGDGVTLTIANALWLQKDFAVEDAFLKMARGPYRATVEQIDLDGDPDGSAKRINGWVSKETNKRIPTLIAADMLRDMPRLVITNAVYFLGDWAQPFQPRATYDEPFYTGKGTENSARMMHGVKNFAYLDGGDFQAVAMPYKDERLEMVVFLPNARDGLAAFERKLIDKTLADWLAKLDTSEKQDVRMTFPKVDVLRTQMALIPLLQRLGMRDVFDRDRSNLGGINPKVQLYVSAAIHKTFLRIDETGTEAAAATGLVVSTVSAPPPMPEFRADHPFWFAIRDRESGTMLFMGRMADPAGG